MKGDAECLHNLKATTNKWGRSAFHEDVSLPLSEPERSWVQNYRPAQASREGEGTAERNDEFVWSLLPFGFSGGSRRLGEGGRGGRERGWLFIWNSYLVCHCENHQAWQSGRLIFYFAVFHYSLQLPISRIYSKELAPLCPADLRRDPGREAHTAGIKGLVLIERESLNKQHAFRNIPTVQTECHVTTFFDIQVFTTLPFLSVYLHSSSF